MSKLGFDTLVSIEYVLPMNNTNNNHHVDVPLELEFLTKFQWYSVFLSSLYSVARALFTSLYRGKKQNLMKMLADLRSGSQTFAFIDSFGSDVINIHLLELQRMSIDSFCTKNIVPLYRSENSLREETLTYKSTIHVTEHSSITIVWPKEHRQQCQL